MAGPGRPRRALPATEPKVPRLIGGVEVTPHYGDRDDKDDAFWLTDGGGVGIQFVISPLAVNPGGWWNIVYHAGPDRDPEAEFRQDALDEITKGRRRDYATAAAAARAAARLVGLLREATKPSSGLQVMAGQWKPWPRGNPATGWK